MSSILFIFTKYGFYYLTVRGCEVGGLS